MTLPAHSYTTEQQNLFDWLEEQHADDHPSLLVTGDSRSKQWPKAQVKTLDQNMVNLGISGVGVQSVLWQLENTQVDLSNLIVAIIGGGVNNLTRLWGAPVDIARGLRDCVEVVKDKAPNCRCLVNIIWPFTVPKLQATSLDDLDETNFRIRNIAAVINPGLYEVFDPPGLLDPTDQTYWKTDGLHLLENGYTEKVTPAAQEQLL